MKNFSSPLPSDRIPSRGFSLVEMLVVVAVIGILAALLFPALQSARERSSSAACLGNLRQLHIAIMALANDNEGQLPLGSDSANNYASWGWYLLEGGYLPKIPQTPGKRPRHPLYDPGSKVTEISSIAGGYGINRRLVDLPIVNPVRTRIVNVSHPSEKFLLMCSGIYSILPSQAAASSLPHLYLPGRSVNRATQWPDKNRQDAIEGRHGRKINTITLSGNAQTWNADELPLTSDHWDR